MQIAESDRGRHNKQGEHEAAQEEVEEEEEVEAAEEDDDAEDEESSVGLRSRRASLRKQMALAEESPVNQSPHRVELWTEQLSNLYRTRCMHEYGCRVKPSTRSDSHWFYLPVSE